MTVEAYKIIEKFHHIYSDDLIFIYELLKQSVIVSK
jgi:hypothetical protein